MPAIINSDDGVASGSSGLKTSGGNDGITQFQQNGTAQAAITPAGLFQFNSGYGSVATAYGCRAWVNFNGSGVVAIRTSGNVTSITDNGTGDYTVNFTTAMPDTNYAAGLGGGSDTATRGSIIMESQIATTSTMRFQVCNAAAAAIDRPVISITIFR